MPRPRNSWPPLAAIGIVLFLGSLDQTIVATALPVIARKLGEPSHFTWIVSSYIATATVALPISGKLGDQFGRKWTLAACLGIFLLGSVLCGLSQTLTQLIMFRALQGFGGGGLMVSAFAAIGDVVAPDQRARVQGWFGAVFGVSTVAGPLIGGFLTEHVGWQSIFLVNLPVGAAAFLLIMAFMPGASASGARNVDVKGIILLSASLAALMTGTQSSAASGVRIDVWSGALLSAAVICAIAFILVERGASDPILPVGLIKRRPLGAPTLVSFVAGIPLFGATTFAPVYWQTVEGLTPTQAGLAVLPLVGGALLASIASGELTARFGRLRLYPIVGAALVSLGLATLALGVGFGNGAGFTAGLALTGVGLGMSLQILLTLAQNAVDQRDIGSATATVTMVRPLGGLLGLAILGAAYAAQADATTPRDALNLVFWVSAAGALLQLFASLLLRGPSLSKGSHAMHFR